MQTRASLAALVILASTAVWADYDPAFEAQEKARRDAAQEAAREHQHKVQELHDDAGAQANKERATGNSMKEIQNMSEAELDVLSTDLEKKYGK